MLRSLLSTPEVVELLQILGPPAFSSAVVLLAFLYLYRVHGDRHLLFWAAAWFLWVVRYLYGIALGDFQLGADAVVLPLLALGRATFMLWGTLAMVGRRLPITWLALVAADSVVVLVAALGGPELVLLGARQLGTYALFAAGLLWSGAIFWSAEQIPTLERRVAGGALILFGLLQATYPWVGMFPRALGEGLYLAVNGVQIAVGLGIILAYLKRTYLESLRLRSELEQTLTKVLGGLIPICSYCRSIKDDHGDWNVLEVYVRDHTDAKLSHGVCPTCAEKHLADFV